MGTVTVRLVPRRPASAHTLKAALLPVEGRAALLERVMGRFANAEWLALEVPAGEYTLTPLRRR